MQSRALISSTVALSAVAATWLFVSAARPDSAIEREFADAERLGQFRNSEIAVRPENAERDRQVEAGTFLLKIGGREVDRHPHNRKKISAVRYSGSNPLLGFANSSIG